jgi:hypothetical protein
VVAPPGGYLAGHDCTRTSYVVESRCAARVSGWAATSDDCAASQLAELTASNETLHAEIEPFTRGGKRQAAPFSTGPQEPEPKRSGRRSGSGTFRDREAPPPEAITDPPVDVQVLHDACPACGGDCAYRTELPERPRPKVPRSRVGGEPASLMAFETNAATVDQIRCRPRHHEVQAVIPTDSTGVMVMDLGRSYGAQACDGIETPKCLAHMLRLIRDVVETKTGRARDGRAQLKPQGQEALVLWRAHRVAQVLDVKLAAEALEAAITYPLRDRRLKDLAHQRRLPQLGWPHDRGNLRRFLADPRIEPSNNRAERARRPAVIAHRVSHCSKSGGGADAFVAFTSISRARMKAGAGSVVKALSALVRSTQPQHIPTPILSPSG